jgi:hypothetical protein
VPGASVVPHVEDFYLIKFRCSKCIYLSLLASTWSAASLAQVPVETSRSDNQTGAPADAEVVVDSTAAAPSASAAATQNAGGASRKSEEDPTNLQPSTAPQAPASAPSVAVPSATPANEKSATVEATRSEPVVKITGYAQLQYESHKDSEDQLRQGGTLLNQDRFLVRRLRIHLTRRYQYTGYFVELDGNTVNGPTFGLNRAEGSVFYQGNNAESQPALIEFTAGLFLMPFGYETPESPRLRWFMERTTASRAFFPSEVDVGVRLHGAWRFLRYGVALTNGEPKGTKSTNFQLQDPNHAKDVILRVGADVPVGDSFRIAGGISYLSGKGFHAGDDATKSRVTWTDTNQNGVITPDELTGIPAAAATPSENFRRWAVGADLQTQLHSRLGWTTLFFEAVAAVNLDRGLYVADPIQTNTDAREFGWHAGFTQEITPYAVVGFRYDSYDPDSDLLDSRGGKFLPASQAIRTYSPLLGVTLPDRARLIFQYDFIRDNLARDTRGVLTDLPNDQWTMRLQVSL